MLPLTIIICTYQREAALADNLRLLFGLRGRPAQSVELRVIVVDQGGTVERSRYPQEWNLKVVRQNNLGGAGGFTRGMLEALDEEAGWILLMDDDAIPDEAAFPILQQFIAQRAPDTSFALHGAMFSAEQPDTIYEAGATLEEPKKQSFDIVQRLRGYRPSIPIEKDPKLWESMGIDYGGWWFFCLHTDTIRRAGLPLPLFLRGDDREYGMRLKAAGIETIPLPGLRAWHTEHGARLESWPIFYDQRNKLIVHALYGDQGRWRLAQKMLYAGFRDILSARYDKALMQVAGLRAYLQGPRHLLQDPGRAAAEIEATAALLTPAAPSAAGPFIPLRGRVRRLRALRVAGHMLLLNGLLCPAKNLRGLPQCRLEEFEWLRVFRLKEYAVSSEDGRTMLFCRNRATALGLAGQLLAGVWQFVAGYSRHAAGWRRESKAMQTPHFWQSILGLAKQPGSPLTARRTRAAAHTEDFPKPVLPHRTS